MWQNFQNLDRGITPGTNRCALARGPGLLDLFAVTDTSKTAYWWSGSNSSQRLTGTSHSIFVEAVSWSTDHMELFPLDRNGKFQHNTWTEAGNWSDSWELVGNDGGPSRYLFTTTALAKAPGGDVFVVDEKSLEVLQTTWLDKATFPILFRNIGGACTSRPTAVAWLEGTILFCRDKDVRLWSISSSGSAWNDWILVPESPVIVAEPQAVSFLDDQNSNRLFVFAQTESSYILGRWVSNSTSSYSLNAVEWHDMSSTWTGPPSVALMKTPAPKVYVAGYNRFRNLMVRHIDVTNGTFMPSAWQDLGHPD